MRHINIDEAEELQGPGTHGKPRCTVGDRSPGVNGGPIREHNASSSAFFRSCPRQPLGGGTVEPVIVVSRPGPDTEGLHE
jgi:hypothetical protein